MDIKEEFILVSVEREDSLMKMQAIILMFCRKTVKEYHLLILCR